MLESVYMERDAKEQLLEIAIEKKIPLFGICRGFHFLNIYFGGSLFHNVKNHVGKNHKLISDNKLLSGWLLTRITIRQSFNRNLAEELMAIAKTNDGVIEALTHKSKKIMGIQWHPERQSKEQDKELILNFLINKIDESNYISSRSRNKVKTIN